MKMVTNPSAPNEKVKGPRKDLSGESKSTCLKCAHS